MVIGTTGFSEAQKSTIALAARDIAIMLAPNMSVGVNVKPDQQTIALYGIENPRTRTRICNFLQTKPEINSAEFKSRFS